MIDVSDWIRQAEGQYASHPMMSFLFAVAATGALVAFLCIVHEEWGEEHWWKTIGAGAIFAVALAAIVLAVGGPLSWMIARTEGSPEASFVSTVEERYGVERLEVRGMRTTRPSGCADRDSTCDAIPLAGRYKASWIQGTRLEAGVLEYGDGHVTLYDADGRPVGNGDA